MDCFQQVVRDGATGSFDATTVTAALLLLENE